MLCNQTASLQHRGHASAPKYSGPSSAQGLRASARQRSHLKPLRSFLMPDTHEIRPPCFCQSSLTPATATIAGNLPKLLDLNDQYDQAHAFSNYANWLIPGHVMLGRYPYCEPSRCHTHAQGEQQLAAILQAGITTFVSLQAEVPPQQLFTDENNSTAFRPYKAAAEEAREQLTSRRTSQGGTQPPNLGSLSNQVAPLPPPLHFVHFPIVDLGIPEASPLLQLVEELRQRLKQGERLYIHCWGGRGRAGTAGACLLGHAYGLPAEEALQRVQMAYSTRMDPQPLSPETHQQRQFVRAFITALGN